MVTGGRAKVESVEQVAASAPRGVLPRDPKEVFEETRATVGSMREEAVNWAFVDAAVGEMLEDWIASSPVGARLGLGHFCSGVGVRTNDGSTVYKMERFIATGGNFDVDVFRRGGNQSVVVGTLDGPGRMNGPFGWSSDQSVVAWALVNFKWNFVGVLLGYFDRPSLPFDGEWELPELISESARATKEPEQAHPDASFTYRMRPSLRASTFVVTVASPTPAVYGVDARDRSGESKARVAQVEVPEGVSRAVIRMPGAPMQGRLDIVPRDAPKGLTVQRVVSTPVSV